jgi:hypothetical protein
MTKVIYNHLRLVVILYFLVAKDKINFNDLTSCKQEVIDLQRVLFCMLNE